MTILKNLQWRRAVKGFAPRNPNGNLHHDRSSDVLKAIRLAPSSFGLQPYIIYNVTSEKILKDLSPNNITFDNGEKIANSSNLLAFGARNDAKNVIDEFQINAEVGDDIVAPMRDILEPMSKEDFQN